MAYTVPVQVVVDLDAQRVTRVVVIDELITADPGGHRELRDSGGAPCSDEQAAAAYAIAEDQPWPGWDSGW